MGLPVRVRRTLTLPPYAQKYLPKDGISYASEPFTYRILYGGRGSSKTWTVASLIVADAARRDCAVICVRDFASSMDLSVKVVIEKMIRRMGLEHCFNIGKWSITGKQPYNKKTKFSFVGIEINEDTVRGWEDAQHVWLEEAQFIKESSFNVLIPTILRFSNCQFWATWNPKHRHQIMWRRFVIERRQNDLVTMVNYNHNPWFPDTMETERLADMKYKPELYPWIWEGEPLDEGGERRVLPYALIRDCKTAYEKYKETHVKTILNGPHPYYAGYDLADGGADRNAIALRKGAVLMHADNWPSRKNKDGLTNPNDSHRRVHNFCKMKGVSTLYYDAGGLGASAKAYFQDLDRAERQYRVEGIVFGAKVEGPDVMFDRKYSNIQYFLHRNSQLAWAVRMRAENTRKLMAGEDIDPDRCLFINPDIMNIDSYTAQLSQPAWDDSQHGKIMIVKRDKNESSPDMYDATVLSFARDSSRGLRAK